jgi:hypothetical protein
MMIKSSNPKKKAGKKLESGYGVEIIVGKLTNLCT